MMNIREEPCVKILIIENLKNEDPNICLEATYQRKREKIAAQPLESV